MKKNAVSKIFNDIENVRKKNNKNWMDLLRLAYNVNSRETVKILTNILNKDQKLITLAKKLKKITK